MPMPRLRPLVPWLALMSVACAEASEPADGPPCELAAIVPGLREVFPAPRPHEVAEVLALSCGEGIAAPAALYASLSVELSAIAAIDPRMRLARGDDSWIYPFASELLSPPTLVADAEALAAARAVLDPDTCAHAVTEALFGVASEVPVGAHEPHLRIDFPARLHPDVLVHVYAALDIPVRAVSSAVGDGSRAAFRDTAAGREYLLEVRGGDCPAGCTFGRSFWWRVGATGSVLLGEWGHDLDDPSGGLVDAPPSGFDPAGFACAKCADGRVSRDPLERACGDGRDDDCDRLVDCDDPDCAEVVPCRREVCDDEADDDGDGRVDCDDADCATALVCGADTACEAAGDRAFLETFAPRGVLAALDRQAAACGQHASPGECFSELFGDSGVSAQCGDCLAEAGLCIVARCPWIGSTEEAHAACVEQCAPLLAPCVSE